jgi:hypothetical protein
VLKAAEIPPSELSTSQPALAWTSWLAGKRATTTDQPPRRGDETDPSVQIFPDLLHLETESIKSQLLRILPRGKQSEFFSMMEAGHYPGNTVVMRQGDPGQFMYFIRRGSVQLFRRTEDGKETLVGILGEGDSFGERALLTGKLQSVTALTVTECEIGTLDKEHFDAFVARYPSLERTRDAYLDRFGPEDHGQSLRLL